MYREDMFTEQAEYIDSVDLDRWHIEHPNEKLIMKKLCQGGAKLLTGPRGCGKTTLLESVELIFCEKDVDNYISKIELGIIEDINVSNELVTISVLESEIKKVLEAAGAVSCVLLLDDAAHAFSKEQQ